MRWHPIRSENCLRFPRHRRPALAGTTGQLGLALSPGPPEELRKLTTSRDRTNEPEKPRPFLLVTSRTSSCDKAPSPRTVPHAMFAWRNSMALVPIKTASETGYCDCVCGCYELASQRDEDTGKGYCPACAKDHLDWNVGVGLPQPAPAKVSANNGSGTSVKPLPPCADPPARLR